MKSTEALRQRTASLLEEITALHPRIEALTQDFAEQIEQVENAANGQEIYQPTYWEKVVCRNALIKLRLILEQNFKFVETLGLLAVTRYIFEVHVWLRTIQSDKEYALVFYRSVIDNRMKHLAESRKKMEEEIEFFEQLEKDERAEFQKSMKTLGPEPSAEKILAIKKSIEEEIDRRARRNFCTHADDAKTNGYGFHAHLLKTQGLSQIDRKLREIEEVRKKFDETCSQSVLAKVKPRWDWSIRAKSIGMHSQYEFIYRYTSRLLHATSVSIYTDQKNLELPEMIMFLEYIYVTILDILELCQQLAGKPAALH